MLYTLSQADYNHAELVALLGNANMHDAVLLWQDGVLLAVKYPNLFGTCKASCYALKPDLGARNLAALISPNVRPISMSLLVKLTERYAPQFGM